MAIRGRRRRAFLRNAHLLLALLLAAYIYTPAADSQTFTWAVRLLALPAVAVSGFLMWKPKLGTRRPSEVSNPVPS